MLYLPYTILSTAEKIITTFPLFIKPVLYTVMLFSLGLSAKHIEKTVKAKKYVSMSFWILIALVCLVAPAVIETMYLMDMSYFLIIVISAVYSAALPVLFILSRLGVLTVRD